MQSKLRERKNTAGSGGSRLKTYMRYAGLGSEMMAMLALSTWVGYKADGWLGLRLPVFLIILPLASLAVLLWKIIKATSKRDG